MLNFSGKIVFITGSGGEIGRTTEQQFIEQGARVVSADISFPFVKDGKIDFGANPVQINLDVSDRERVNSVVERVVEKFETIDIVINAAGILNIQPFLEITEENWERVFSINVKGLFFVCQAALKQMIKQQKGCFVNFASVSGKVGGVLAGADYSASKAAVICITKSLAKAGAPYKIRANSVAPGAIYSPMLDSYYHNFAEQMRDSEKSHPFKRFGKPLEVANAVLFLASEEASWITGACLDINGGSHMD